MVQILVKAIGFNLEIFCNFITLYFLETDRIFGRYRSHTYMIEIAYERQWKRAFRVLANILVVEHNVGEGANNGE